MFGPSHLRRLLTAVGLACLPVLVAAQNVTYEAVTFTGTATGFATATITPPGQPQLVTCEGKLETAQIRVRYDGTLPTAAEGTLFDVGDVIRIDGHQALDLFRGIRTGATSGVIRFHCTQSPSLERSGASVTSGGGGGGDGALLDGANAAVKATVFDLTNSNPLATQLVDANGDVQAIGGGTQVTEDAPAAANPVGNQIMGRRRDTLSAAEVSADLDSIAGNMTAKGELYVKQTDPVPATQSGTWTVQPGNTANTTAWLVTGTGGTFPSTQSGTWTVQPGNTANTTAWLVTGGKTNNTAAPGTTNLGVLSGVANASAPTQTEGNLVALSVDLGGALRVSGAGGGTQYTQDAALTVATSVGGMSMGRASAGAPTDVSADNDAVLPWYLRSGAQAVQPTFAGIFATTGNGVAGTGVQRVSIASDSTGIVNPGNTANTTPWLITPYQGGANLFPAAAALADNTANPTTTGLAAYMFAWDTAGSNWDRYTPAQDGNHGSTTAANGPRQIAEATSSVSGGTNVTNGQDTRLKADLSGVLITRPYANPEDTISTTPLALTATTTATSLIAAAGAGIRNYLTTLECSNTSATNTTIDIRDGTAGAVLWTVSCPANGGGVRTFAIPLRGSANTALAAQSSVSVSTVTVSAIGFKSKL